MACRAHLGQSTSVESDHGPDAFVNQTVERAGLREPDGTALRHGDLSLSQRHITEYATPLAPHLLDRRAMPGSVVAVLLPAVESNDLSCIIHTSFSRPDHGVEAMLNGRRPQ